MNFNNFGRDSNAIVRDFNRYLGLDGLMPRSATPSFSAPSPPTPSFSLRVDTMPAAPSFHNDMLRSVLQAPPPPPMPTGVELHAIGAQRVQTHSGLSNEQIGRAAGVAVVADG
jgi:hypothetical protein